MSELTFGQFIRAARLGYHPLDGRVLVRVSEVPIGWEVRCHPLRLLTASRTSEPHVVWWNDEDAKAALRGLGCIKSWSERDGARTFVVNDEGELL